MLFLLIIFIYIGFNFKRYKKGSKKDQKKAKSIKINKNCIETQKEVILYYHLYYYYYIVILIFLILIVTKRIKKGSKKYQKYQNCNFDRYNKDQNSKKYNKTRTIKYIFHMLE